MEFPPEVRALYPTVDWSVVQLARGLPWYARRGTRAMVVPRAGSRRGLRVHVRRDVDLESDAGRRLLAHEAYHVLQYQESRWGFVVAYLLLAARFGFGPRHPLEAPAYEAGRSLRGAASTGDSPWRALRRLLRG